MYSDAAVQHNQDTGCGSRFKRIFWILRPIWQQVKPNIVSAIVLAKRKVLKVVTINEAIKAELAYFGKLTNGKFDAWMLMGDKWRFARQRLMSALLGKKIPVAGCGVNALRRVLLDAAGWSPTKGPMPVLCEASKDELIKRWCEGVLSWAFKKNLRYCKLSTQVRRWSLPWATFTRSTVERLSSAVSCSD